MKRERQGAPSSSSTVADNDGAGHSRASKKRAKKKEKKSNPTTSTSLAASIVNKHEKPQSVPKQSATKPPSALQSKPEGELKTTGLEACDTSTTDPLTLLPLVQILLVQGGDSEKDLHSRHQLQQMTARERAKIVLSTMLGPTITCEEFYKEYWEKKPLLIRAPPINRNRFEELLSLESIQQLLDKESLCYGSDLNVARYIEDPSSGIKRRITLDPQLPVDIINGNGENQFVAVDAKDVWSNFESGCTIRLLCPQRFVPQVHHLLSSLELEWGCMVGANAYLTPPNGHQGFAPHYDDIEAFCLQLEGRKRWKVYKPPQDQVLPRYSSPDFTEQDLYDMGNPLMDEILESGDLLYMPRGWIHQACTLPKSAGQTMHSLHMTVSAMQQWAWVDFLDIVMPAALEATTMKSMSLREGLPRRFLDYMGAMHDVADDDLPEPLKVKPGQAGADDDEIDEETMVIQKLKQKQDQFRSEAKKRIMLVAQQAIKMVDTSCDQIGKRFLSDRLPPAFTEMEASLTNEGNPKAKITASTMCRLARPGIARLVLEDDKAVLYHCGDNSCVYHGQPLEPMEFEMDDAAALEQLLTTVEPHWICVRDLFHDEIQDKIDIANALFKEGILAVFNESSK